MDIQIKRLKKKDLNKVIDFAVEGMHFDRYVDSKIALSLYGRYFLYLELKRANHIIAAYMGDRLVGILMADMNNRPMFNSSFWRNLYIKIADIILKTGFKSGTNRYDEANAIMLKSFKKNAEPDGEICFLAADPTIHGKGIGTKLLEELKKREKGKLIYLFTDDNCTYQFYEHKGFERSEEQKILMDIHGKQIPLTCLLYSLTL